MDMDPTQNQLQVGSGGRAVVSVGRYQRGERRRHGWVRVLSVSW